jgi:hypothetical protein
MSNKPFRHDVLWNLLQDLAISPNLRGISGTRDINRLAKNRSGNGCDQGKGKSDIALRHPQGT